VSTQTSQLNPRAAQSASILQRSNVCIRPSGYDNPDTPGAVDAPPPVPERIGRYRVERLLGEGGFGRVYLAHDEELRRPVAVKVPHPHRISRPEDVELYLAEARLLAGLEYPHSVAVAARSLRWQSPRSSASAMRHQRPLRSAQPRQVDRPEVSVVPSKPVLTTHRRPVYTLEGDHYRDGDD
jgi:serine/threonine protein kinase